MTIGERPLFDRGKVPADLTRAGGQPAEDLWGIGKKTAERLREKLRLDPGTTPTVADFAYANLDKFEVAPDQHSLLRDQQAKLINELHIPPEAAQSGVAADLIAAMNLMTEQAISDLTTGAKPKNFVRDRLVTYARDMGMGYGMFGDVVIPTADQVAKAHALGMPPLEEGWVALAVRFGAAGETDPGVVVVPMKPRDHFQPSTVDFPDGTRQHGFTAQPYVERVRGFVVEEPTDALAKVKSLEAQAHDLSAEVWAVKDPAERRVRLDASSVKIDELEKAISVRDLGSQHASTVLSAVHALREIYKFSASLIDK